MGGNKVVLLFAAFLQERECVEKLRRMKNGIVSTFSFSPCKQCRAMQRNSTLVLQSYKRLHKLCFLQKQGCQKPCWDQARLSSLVNNQVVTVVKEVTEVTVVRQNIAKNKI